MTREAELEALCLACGLCCDGSLFGRARLEPGEVERARKIGLRVLPSGGSFEQPCSALGEGRACAVYTERPNACRAFVCGLWDEHRREGGALAPRLETIARARSLLDAFEKSGFLQSFEGAGELAELMKCFERAIVTPDKDA